MIVCTCARWLWPKRINHWFDTAAALSRKADAFVSNRHTFTTGGFALSGRSEKFVVPPTRFFRDVFNKISAMEPFESFFRVLFLNAIDFERMWKTCTATLCAQEGMSYRKQCRSFETLHCDISFSYTDFSFLQEQEGKRLRSTMTLWLGALSTPVFLWSR